jgi:nucleoside-diphosphate-sugar epimerase
MKKVIVTGGSGKAGRAAIAELVEHGYEVGNLDLMPSPDERAAFTRVDVTDIGQVMDAFSGIEGRFAVQEPEAVLHLAAIPRPGLAANETIFRINMISTYNVFAAATKLGFKRVVWATSETVLGLPFERQPPAYVPIDEEAPPVPETAYALSKVLGEELARHYSRWYPDIPFVGLRFSNVMEPHDYAMFADFQKDARLRKWNLWGYVDARDVGRSCRLALEADITGAENFIIAAADTVMERPNAELLAEVFPDTPVRGEIGAHNSLLSIEKARRVLGYEPEYSWRDPASHQT